MRIDWRSVWTRPRIVVAVTLLGLALRLWAAWQLPVDFDEPVYVDAAYQYAEMLRAGDIQGIIDFRQNSEHPPLVKLLYGGVLSVMGQYVTWEGALTMARLVSALFGTLAVLVVATFDPLAGGLLAVQTLVLKYTSQAYLEALPLFTMLLAVFTLRRTAKREGATILDAAQTRLDGWFWISALALGLTAAGKFSYFPILLVILYVAVWEKRLRWWEIGIYLGVAALVFWIFDPALWRDPIGRLQETVTFHVQYSQGAHVEEVGYPWYQPWLWVSRSWGFVWHPDMVFYMGFDGLIFLFALPGVWRERKRLSWVVAWWGVGMLFLLLWPTRWPQYTLVVLPAYCLLAAPTATAAYRWLKEQNAYWDWLQNVLPKPSRRFVLVALSLVGLLVLASAANIVLVSINRLGWSHLTAENSRLPSNTVYDLLALHDGGMLVASDNGAALYQEAGENDITAQWEVFDTSNSTLPDRRVLALAQDTTGVLWFGTARGLASWDGENWEVHQPGGDRRSIDQVNALAVDRQGRLWVGSNSGAAVYDGQSWATFTVGNSGLLDYAVFCLAVEPRPSGDVIWFGSLSGVASYDIAADVWQSYSAADVELGWGGVADVLVDTSGGVWVATLGGGLSRWDGEGWSYLRASNSDLPYNTVQEIAENAPGSFWISVALPNETGGVLTHYEDGIWRTYNPSLSGYSGAETLAIAQDSSGRLWFATRTGGIDLYQPRR
ncbi:MAG: hypothetical protein JW726_01545 [Anaerolineales bacterium]|nr:hypothetical protein [Anaerolineales bacterium]